MISTLEVAKNNTLKKVIFFGLVNTFAENLKDWKKKEHDGLFLNCSFSKGTAKLSVFTCLSEMNIGIGLKLCKGKKLLASTLWKPEEVEPKIREYLHAISEWESVK